MRRSEYRSLVEVVFSLCSQWYGSRSEYFGKQYLLARRCGNLRLLVGESKATSCKLLSRLLVDQDLTHAQPPAVNAGILWVFAILIRIGAVDAPNIQDNDGNPYDYNLIAVTSFALTMVNIVCIWVSGMLMFRIKEVAPTRSKSAFWSRDIKVARAIQKGSKDVNLDVIKAGLQDAIKKERDQEKAIVRQKQHKRHKHRGDIPFNIAVNPEVAPVLDVGDFERPASFRKDSSIRRNNNTTFSMRDMADLLGVDSDDSDDETVPAGVRRRRV